MSKNCILETSKICNGCNKCNICDLNPEKICDNCGKCLEIDDKDYIEIKIEGILDGEEEIEEYIFEIEEGDNESLEENEDDGFNDCLYIEDIPKLKEEYDKKINEILRRKRVE
ncbi:hypothetical protein FDN13_00565 [Caloramator sp. E03]|uniref:hypothetical protein n=1 Tax=Caloramator sp. E03 TaxID=2576307 RepID=UPI0011104957|nr:hypothetical protein [Caloramator sp. E03]QCX32308.1 hypothetical protein FDN13_00565 [Caloramator sp. E03]